ncbi:MAG: hypothetical protein H7232_03515 [Aeromicrobium sp.]|nr:hypothetical protein [Burkholderiales bacterium]
MRKFPMVIVVTASAAAAVVFAGCVTRTTTSESSIAPAALVTALGGAYTNAAQYQAAPAALKVAPSVAGEWLDSQHAQFVRVDAPKIGSHVLYLEWRSGSKTGPVSRQRIWSFRTDASGATRMDFFAFVDGAPWVGQAATPNAFQNLTLDKLRGYGDTCALMFVPDAKSKDKGIVGSISGKECSITAASGRRMAIDARIDLLPDGSVQYRESGQLEDGRFAFRVPPTEPYRFVRMP